MNNRKKTTVHRVSISLNTVTVEEVIGRNAGEVSMPVRERHMEQKSGVVGQRENDGKEWETVNKDLWIILCRLKGNVIERLEKMGGIVYSSGAERFGVHDKKRGERIQV